jgi:hypothetical protein
MGTTTARLALYKPAVAGEIVDIALLNANMDKLDVSAGAVVCTSSTRPASPFDGMLIKETDTKAIGYWDAASTTWMIFDTIWQTYVPTLTFSGGTITLGNGFLGGSYMRRGKNVSVRVGFSLGTTTSYGASAGTLQVTLPINMVSSAGAPYGTLARTNGALRGVGSTPFLGQVFLNPAVFVHIFNLVIMVGAAVDTLVTNTQFSANGHYWTCAFEYESV